MQKLDLKSLKIVNFKGIKDFTVDLKHNTNIYGENGTGKTTVFDSFLWLFFGKNSEDASKFEIKRLDANNKFIKDIETEVTAIIQVNGEEIAVRKVLRQKWVKRHGELESNYNGDENNYFWNDVPMKEGEFVAKIKTIVDENLFKLITNPFYFNNSIKWQDRRTILTEMAGDVTNDEVFSKVVTDVNKQSFESLINALNSGKSIKEFQAQIAAQKKKLKDEVEYIPSRIDEVQRGMPEDLNFDSIKDEIIGLQNEIGGLDNLLNDEVEQVKAQQKANADLQTEYNNKVQKRQQTIFDTKSKMQNIEFEVKQKAKESGSTLDAEIKSTSAALTDKKFELTKYETSLNNFKNEITVKEAFVDDKRTQYSELDAKELEFDEHQFVCPSCKQDLPNGDIESQKETLTTNFNTTKKAKLETIIGEANTAKAEIEKLKERIANSEAFIKTLTDDVLNLELKLADLQQQALQPTKSVEDITKELLAANEEYQKLNRLLFATEGTNIEQPEFAPIANNEEAKNKREALQTKIADLQKELAKEEQRNAALARVKQLSESEAKLNQEIADLEKSEFAIAEFNKAKMATVESRINKYFSMVTFKMFKEQVNGGEEPCCETLINGVPFSDANNASKINAGIDIINALSKYYNITAPIFIDNRESVTKLIDSDSQIVNLIVSESHKKLTVA